MDFMVNLPMTGRKNRHIITMTEGLTKWCEAKAVRDATAKVAAGFLMDITHRFGLPLAIITDNGSHFRGDFHELCIKLGIQHRFATAYHPQTAGQDERTNGLLLGRVRKWRLEEYNKWDEDLPAGVLACNTRKISSTKFSAMESLMGYTAHTASDAQLRKLSKAETEFRLDLEKNEELEDILTSRLYRLESVREESTRVKDAQAVKMKETYDRRVHSKELGVGDEVLLYNLALLKQWSRKLEERWLGPYTVVWKGTQGAYAIADETGKTKLASGDQLKRYHRR